MKVYREDSRITATIVVRGKLSINEPLNCRVALDLKLLAESLLFGCINLKQRINVEMVK